MLAERYIEQDPARRQEELAQRLEEYPVSAVREDMLAQIAAKEAAKPGKKEVTVREVLGTYIETTSTGSKVLQKLLGSSTLSTDKFGEPIDKLYFYEVEYSGWPARNLDEEDPDIKQAQIDLISQELMNQLKHYLVVFNADKSDDRIAKLDLHNAHPNIHAKHMFWRPIDEAAGLFELAPMKLDPIDEKAYPKLMEKPDQIEGGLEFNAVPGTGKSHLTRHLESLNMFGWSSPEGDNRSVTGFMNNIKFNYVIRIFKANNGEVMAELYSNLLGGNMPINDKVVNHFGLVDGKFQKVHAQMFPGADQTADINKILPRLQQAMNNKALIRPLSDFEVLLAYMQKSLARDFNMNYALYAKATSTTDGKNIAPCPLVAYCKT